MSKGRSNLHGIYVQEAQFFGLACRAKMASERYERCSFLSKSNKPQGQVFILFFSDIHMAASLWPTEASK